MHTKLRHQSPAYDSKPDYCIWYCTLEGGDRRGTILTIPAFFAWLDVDRTWKLTSVILDSYTQERKPHIRELVATTKALGSSANWIPTESAASRRDTWRRSRFGSFGNETPKIYPGSHRPASATTRDGRLQHPADDRAHSLYGYAAVANSSRAPAAISKERTRAAWS
jgi:hypothetical protein